MGYTCAPKKLNSCRDKRYPYTLPSHNVNRCIQACQSRRSRWFQPHCSRGWKHTHCELSHRNCQHIQQGRNMVLRVFIAGASMLAGIPSTRISGSFTGSPCTHEDIGTGSSFPLGYSLKWQFLGRGQRSKGLLDLHSPCPNYWLCLSNKCHMENCFWQEYKRHLVLVLLQNESWHLKSLQD